MKIRMRVRRFSLPQQKSIKRERAVGEIKVRLHFELVTRKASDRGARHCLWIRGRDAG
jgi:hypothetical protein